MGLLDRLRKDPPSPAELDELSLKQLRAAGADLGRARHVLHFLYFDDEPAARAAATEISEAGYDATVAEPDEQIAQWSVRAESTRVVDETTVHAFRPWFERVAAEHGGAYDGWEAATKP